MSYRKLKQNEIDQLTTNGCISKDWQIINVVENFKSDNIQNVSFSGEIFLGNFNNEIEALSSCVVVLLSTSLAAS